MRNEATHIYYHQWCDERITKHFSAQLQIYKTSEQLFENRTNPTTKIYHIPFRIPTCTKHLSAADFGSHFDQQIKTNNSAIPVCPCHHHLLSLAPTTITINSNTHLWDRAWLQNDKPNLCLALWAACAPCRKLSVKNVQWNLLKRSKKNCNKKVCKRFLEGCWFLGSYYGKE